MARPKGGSGDAREKLVAALGRGFRSSGFGGAGVDGLSKEAGLTSGAFYAQFGSKAAAFTVAVEEGLRDLRRGIERFQATHGKDWLRPFIAFYLEERMAVPLPEACALPSLSADVARAAPETRAAYTRELLAIADLVAEGLAGEDRGARAWRLLALLAGAASLARAVDDPALRAMLLAAAAEGAEAAAAATPAGPAQPGATT